MKLPICLLLLGILGGCSSTPAKPVSTPAAHTPQESSYLNTLRSKYPEYSTVGDSLLIDTAKNVCSKLDHGTPVLDIVTAPVDPPLTPSMWAYNVGAAIGIFCPAHSKDIRELQQRLGG